MATTDHFIRWLEDMMGEYGLQSRAALAKELRISVETVNKWFGARRSKPVPLTVKKLAALFDVETSLIDAIISADKHGTAPPERHVAGQPENLGEGAEFLRIQQMLHSLPPRKRQRLLGYIESKYEDLQESK